MAKKPEPTAAPPQHFFAKELAGETPLSLQTATDLFRVASEIYGIQPWKYLTEEKLVFVPLPDGRLAMASIMGSVGEFHAVMVYFGGEGYDLFCAANEGELDAAEYHIRRNSLHVEYVPSSQLEKADKELLRTLGHPASGKMYAPAFRSTRPGYLPWHVNEEEAQTLGYVLAALIVFLKNLRNAKTNPWEDESDYPSAVLQSDWREPELRAEIGSMSAPDVPEHAPEPLKWDEAAAGLVTSRATRTQNTWEADLFPMPIPIGKANERKRMPNCMMLVDGASGTILGLEMVEGLESGGELLIQYVLKAVNATKTVPSEILVSDPELADLLGPFCKAYSIYVQASPVLPALDTAREGMIEYLSGGR